MLSDASGLEFVPPRNAYHRDLGSEEALGGAEAL